MRGLKNLRNIQDQWFFHENLRNWFENEQVRNALFDAEGENPWARWQTQDQNEALGHFESLKKHLPLALSDKSRAGLLVNLRDPISGESLPSFGIKSLADGRVLPLFVNTRVTLIDLAGNIYYQGKFGDTVLGHLRAEGFFVFAEVALSGPGTIHFSRTNNQVR